VGSVQVDALLQQRDELLKVGAQLVVAQQLQQVIVVHDDVQTELKYKRVAYKTN